MARIELLLPVIPCNHTHLGRKRLDDRKAPCGILFVPDTGIRWEFLHRKLGSGSGMTCWRRLRDRNEAGARHCLHVLLALPRARRPAWTSPAPQPIPATCARWGR